MRYSLIKSNCLKPRFEINLDICMYIYDRNVYHRPDTQCTVLCIPALSFVKRRGHSVRDILHSRRCSVTKHIEQRSPRSFVLSVVVERDGVGTGDVRGLIARTRARGFASSTATKT